MYRMKESSHVTKLSPIFPLVILVNYSVHLSHQAEWVTDPFTLKFYSLLQNIISLNFRDGLNFATCQHSFRRDFSNILIILFDRKEKLKTPEYDCKNFLPCRILHRIQSTCRICFRNGSSCGMPWQSCSET